MQNINTKERTLIRVRQASIGVLCLLLVGGTAMIGISALTNILAYFIDGAVILLTSPLFLVLAVIARRKMNELGI